MGFGEAVKTALTTKYADFSGRSTRSEYWWFQLFNMLVAAGSVTLVFAIGAGTRAASEPSSFEAEFAGFAVVGVYLLVFLIPTVAVTVRRLHDAGMSGWVYLVVLLPFGGLFLLLLACLDSRPANRWGPNPKDPQGMLVAPVVAGWYANPDGTSRLRYWDGSAWTAHVSD